MYFCWASTTNYELQKVYLLKKGIQVKLVSYDVYCDSPMTALGGIMHRLLGYGLGLCLFVGDLGFIIYPILFLISGFTVPIPSKALKKVYSCSLHSWTQPYRIYDHPLPHADTANACRWSMQCCYVVAHSLVIHRPMKLFIVCFVFLLNRHCKFFLKHVPQEYISRITSKHFICFITRVLRTLFALPLQNGKDLLILI